MKRTIIAVACWSVLVGASIAQQPSNDACQNAIYLQNGINPSAPNGASGNFYSNVGSLGNDVPGFCTAGADTKDVWFQWYSTGSGTATVTSCTPFGFTPGTASVSIEAYAWCQGPVSACSQPACGGGATLSMTVLNGSLYLIRVATIAPTQGGGTFYLTLTSPPSPPLNDNLLGAFQVYPGTNPATGTYTTIAATLDGTGACTTPAEIDVWFRYQPGTSGTATLSTPGSTLNLQITNSAGAVVACGTTSFPVAFPVTGGAVSTIRIASQVGQGTNFTLTIVPPAPPPPNDECTNSVPLVVGANGPFAPSNATPSPGSFSCAGGADVWYSFTTGPCPSFHTFASTGGFGLTNACGPNPPVWYCSSQNGWGSGGGGSTGGGVGGVGGPTALYIPTTANTTYRLCVPASAAHTITITRGVFVSQSPVTYLDLVFSSPFGPGSIQASALAGPPNGVWYLAVTLNQGSFPNGAVYGLDMTIADVMAQFITGPPFTGSFDSCGHFQLGPFAGLPSGLTIFSVLFGFAGGYSATPTIYSLPTFDQVP